MMNYWCSTQWRLQAALVLGLVVFSSIGCGGYRWAPEYNQLPAGIHTVAIPLFKNNTYESNIEAYVTNALMNEFIRNQQFSVVSEGGDATLSGMVKKFDTMSIAYSSEDRARQYRAYLTLEVTLRDNRTGEVLWRNPELVHEEEYSVEPIISFTDARKQDAIKRISADLAERIYEEIVYGY